MYLRKLEVKDASLMLEWMHDDDVTNKLSTNFADKSLQDCENFIVSSADTTNNLHMAIASDTDEYMGTVSLKHIDIESGNAEFAITVRKASMGKGYSWFGMVEIIRIAFEDLGLNSVYWCVSTKNERACRFYDKHGFHEALDISNEILARYEGVQNLRWYSVLNGDDYQNKAMKRGEVVSCRIIKIKTIPTVNAGELSFFEANQDIPFDVKRIYYISKVPEGVRRGFHAHKKLKQLLFCPYGKIQLILDDGVKREEITLSDPSIGIVIENPIWREMLWLEKDSVLCVAASDYYSAEDYIRYYDEFLNFVNMGGAK
ncbi:GNAT family N-acetyltransferase [Clostridium algidicarnis]|uniref:GNAT family N-acetyltransferase n=1 Tax=Clostridium algidicarnis TaxID=37659 RepID=UPI001623A779|nr:GNAT family N-acetyltransferase [Clostridium algidicarnis]MBB6698250.1 GNAT family N-acetyltransferase [Clostridium algidicarnis]